MQGQLLQRPASAWWSGSAASSWSLLCNCSATHVPACFQFLRTGQLMAAWLLRLILWIIQQPQATKGSLMHRGHCIVANELSRHWPHASTAHWPPLGFLNLVSWHVWCPWRCIHWFQRCQSDCPMGHVTESNLEHAPHGCCASSGWGCSFFTAAIKLVHSSCCCSGRHLLHLASLTEWSRQDFIAQMTNLAW